MSHVRVLQGSRSLVWLPAALLMTWGLLAAAGVFVTPTSKAASSSSTVNATVALDVHIAGTCAAGTNFPSVALALGENTLATCGITFGTNNGASSALRVESPRPTTGNPMFCQAATVSTACGANVMANPAANALTLGDNQMGVLSTAVTTCTTPTWQLNRYNPVRDAGTAGAGDLVCTMTGTTDGNYTLSFRANRSASTVAGTYAGQAVFTAEAS
jgi:hypothetical protein